MEGVDTKSADPGWDGGPFFFGKTDFQVGIDTKSRGGVQNFEKFLSKI